MPYITCVLPERHRQMSFEEMLAFQPGVDDIGKYRISSLPNSTRTILSKEVPKSLVEKTNLNAIKRALIAFNKETNALHQLMDEANQKMIPLNQAKKNGEISEAEFTRAMQEVYSELYYFFKIPKKNGKWRQISAPLPPLMDALRELKDIIYSPGCSSMMLSDHHTSAFAYISKRNCKMVAIRHQKNKSHWFAHFDFHDFFGSTTPEFVFRMLDNIYPFCLFDEELKGEFHKALSLCFLNGGLPQGTPISPLLTNVMMIPFDHQMTKMLNHYAGARKEGQSGHEAGDHFVYTRYADDINISCVVEFDVKRIEQVINGWLSHFDAPFRLASEKTRYNSRAGKNWMLGVLLNADNNITVGHENKKIMKAMITNYVLDKKQAANTGNRKWSLESVYELSGKLSYYRSIEKDYIDYVLQQYGRKFNIDILESIKEDIRIGI